MEEINLKDLFLYFISKIFIVIITLVFAVSISIVYSKFIKVPKYSSYTTIVLTRSGDNGNEQNASITQNDITLNQKLVATYREIIKSRRVLGQVKDNLGLDSSVGEISSNISVTNPDGTELIKIKVTGKNKEEVKDITNEIARVFSKEIEEIYDIKNVSIIDTAIEAGSPYNMNLVKETVIASLLGLALGLGIVFIMFYFDTTIKNTDEVQEKVGLPLLGVVPKVDTGKKKKSKNKKKKNRGNK